jgi:hypothetical protein
MRLTSCELEQSSVEYDANNWLHTPCLNALDERYLTDSKAYPLIYDNANTTEIIDRTLENALICVTKTIDKIMTGEIDRADLIISKQLRMDITKYRSLFPQVAAAV